MNLQRFRTLLCVKITTELLVKESFLRGMGIIGGFLPAVRAASMPVASALREL